MLISTKGRYALRVMVEMARRKDEGYISLKSVAQRQGISEKYMEAIMKSLVSAGLTVGLRGKGGGYKLAVPPQACTAAAILRAAEGSLAPVACLEEGAELCERRDSCSTLPLWKELEDVVENFLGSYTLEQLAQGPQA